MSAMFAIRGAFWNVSHGRTGCVALKIVGGPRRVSVGGRLSAGAALIMALPFLLNSPAHAASRLRIEDGARARQVRLAPANLVTSCAVLDDGTVRCWGLNVYGQVGDGTVTSPRKSPVAVMTGKTSLLTNVASVSAGYSHTCAVVAIGAAFCWGSNFYGELGTGNTTQSSFAVPVHNISKVVAVAAGYLFTCALRSDGTVWCWGANVAGELGNGSTADSTTPVQAHISGAAVAITAGTAQACAVLVGGHVQCWGGNSAGQLGDGTYTSRPSPVTVTFPSRFVGLQPLSSVVDVSAGDRHTCALIADGTVYCWGANDSGQLGNNSTAANSNVAVEVVTNLSMAPLTGAVAATAGSNHSCALLAAGAVKCWGANDKGQLGNGTTGTTPHRIADTTVAGLANAIEVVTGYGYTCAVEAVNWTGRCWGDNASGELGNGTTTPTSVPNTVSGVAGSIGGRGIQAIGSANCARRGNDNVACWGDGSFGELGNGSFFSNSSDAVAVSGLNDAVSLGSGSLGHVCALRASGTVSCWGFNSNGQLGIGVLTDPQTSPVAVAGLTGVVQVAAGGAHTCALLADGTVSCWGYNGSGQLGNGTYSDSSTPVAVSGLGNVVMISAGYVHTCAVLVNGTVRCWGDNFYGELGDAKAELSSPVPVAVLGINNIVAISAGGEYSCALSATGGANCWGRNDHGQLGDTTISDQSVPDVVSGLTNALGVAASRLGAHTCAVLAGGSASCWGADDSGQLGAKDLAEYHSPTPVIDYFATINGLQFAFPLSQVIAISPGASHTCALLGNGELKCWGADDVGQIGNGTFSLSIVPRPTVVNSFTANVQPDATLKSSGRIVEVTALVNCPEGGEAHISLTLQQGQTTGSGGLVSACISGQAEIPMAIPAQGSSEFEIGSATANVEAVVKDRGTVTEDQHWTRTVTIFRPL